MSEHSIDPKAAAEKIVQLVGGADNIESVTHCFTRLRLVLADRSAADDEKIKTIPGVQGIIFIAGQYQIVLGRNLYPVFAAVNERCNGRGRAIMDRPPPALHKDENK